MMGNAILTSCQYQNYRRIDLIVIHCSATRATQSYTMDDCRRDYRARSFADIGYHYYITRNGVVHRRRPLYTVGHMPRATMSIASESAMRADSMPATGQKIPELRSKKKRSNDCWNV